MTLFRNVVLTILLIVAQVCGINVADIPMFDEAKFTSAEISALADCENLAEKASITDQEQEPVTGMTDGEKKTGVTVQRGDNLYFTFDQPISLNSIVLQEATNKIGISTSPLEGGTRQFSIYATINGKEELIYRNDKIDAYRLCTFPRITCEAIRIQFDSCRFNAKINEVGFYDAGKTKKDFRINDYFVYEGNDFQNDEKFKGYLDTVTDLTLFLGVVGINADGDVTYSPNKETFAERLDDLREALGGRDIKLYCNVFSNDADASFFSNSKKLAENLASFVTEFELDGVDFDWEYPDTSEDWDAYNQLALDLRAEFDKIEKKFSFATAGWNMKFSEEAMEAVDYYNLMVYDNTTRDFHGYHSTFKQATNAVERLLYQGYDPEKICLGVPYYGRNIRLGNNGGGRWYNYVNSGITDPWTNVSTMPIDVGNGEISMQKGYFNGYAMIRDKTAYAVDMNLGGIMTWHMTADLPIEDSLSLHRAVQEACEQRLEQ